MADAEEGSYEHACMRAELLGLPVPDRETFVATVLHKEPEVEEEEVLAAQSQEEERQREETRGAAGGLEELNSILSITQSKINRFKTVCGSIKNLFSLRGSQQDLSEESSAELKEKAAAAEPEPKLDPLDSLLAKAERAEISMSSQNKQMRSLLR